MNDRRGMPAGTLAALRGVVARHPWWRARWRLTRALLRELGLVPPARVADVGCGWGVTLRGLEDEGYVATGLDVDREALAALAAEQPGHGLAHCDLSMPVTDPEAPFDAVLALDVLEHLDDDVLGATHLKSLADRQAPIIVSVPADAALWSEFDEIQGHFRRYSAGELTGTLESAGLRVERLFAWGGWLRPVLQRQRSRPKRRAGDSDAEAYARYLHVPARPIDRVLDACFRLEEPRALAGRVRRGTSIWAVARSREASESTWEAQERHTDP